LSSVITPLKRLFHAIEPNLTLDGLRIIGQFVQTQTPAMTDPQPWKTLRTEMVLDLRWYKVRREEVQLPDGRILDDYYVSVRPEVALVFPSRRKAK
jgi:hypothetical protein